MPRDWNFVVSIEFDPIFCFFSFLSLFDIDLDGSRYTLIKKRYAASFSIQDASYIFNINPLRKLKECLNCAPDQSHLDHGRNHKVAKFKKEI